MTWGQSSIVALASQKRALSMKEDERKSLRFSTLLGGTPTPTPDRFGVSSR
jgi:hypothetical protein